MLFALRRLLFAFALVAGVAARAQLNFGTISGTVTDPTGGPIAGATVTLTSTDRNVSVSTTANDGGRYALLSLQPGPYSLTASFSGFKSKRVGTIQLFTGATLELNSSVGGRRRSGTGGSHCLACAREPEHFRGQWRGRFAEDRRDAAAGKGLLVIGDSVAGNEFRAARGCPPVRRRHLRRCGYQPGRVPRDCGRQRCSTRSESLLRRRHRQHGFLSKESDRPAFSGCGTGVPGATEPAVGGVRRSGRRSDQRDHQVGNQHPAWGSLGFLPQRRARCPEFF